MRQIDIASSYLDALASRDPNLVPFTSDARRVNNGRPSATGADALREGIRNEPPLDFGAGRRWVVNGDEVAVFYELAADMGKGAPIPVGIGERFLLRDGAICEIEAVHATGPGLPTDWLDSTATSDGDPGVEAAARAYLDALVSHDAAGLPLADDVRRMENGQMTGSGPVDLRASLESDVMLSVQATSDEHWLLAGDSAVVFYSLLAKFGDDTMLVRIAERFRVRAGEITEIEAIFAA